MSSFSIINKPKYSLLIEAKTEDEINNLINLIKSENIRSKNYLFKDIKNFSNHLNQTPYHIQTNSLIIKELINNKYKNYKQLDYYNQTCLHPINNNIKDYHSYELLLPLLKRKDLHNQLNNDGNTILFSSYSRDLIELILSYDVNPLILNNNGESCIDYQDNNESKQYLINYINNYINLKYGEYLRQLKKSDIIRHKLEIKFRNINLKKINNNEDIDINNNEIYEKLIDNDGTRKLYDTIILERILSREEFGIILKHYSIFFIFDSFKYSRKLLNKNSLEEDLLDEEFVWLSTM